MSEEINGGAEVTQEGGKAEDMASKASEASNKASEAVNKASEAVNRYSGKVDELVNRGLGFITEHPWERWIECVNKYVSMFLPAVIAIAGVLGVVLGIVFAIKNDFPFKFVVYFLLAIVPVALSMHLSGKAAGLAKSFLTKREAYAVRPELLYIVKAVCGLGSVAAAIALVLEFNADLLIAAVVILFLAALVMIVVSHPELIGFKSDYPTNAVEEGIAIVLFPIHILISFLPIITGLATVGTFVYAVRTLLFESAELSTAIFIADSLLPLVIPLVAYFFYLSTVFFLDLYRAVVSIPRKLDEVIAK